MVEVLRYVHRNRRLIRDGAQGGHLNFHTAPSELCNCCGQKHVDIVTVNSVTTGVVKGCNACRHIWLHKGQFEFEFDCYHDRQTSLITVSGIETAAASFPSLTGERTKQATLHWKSWHDDPILFESMHGPTGSTSILAGKRINGGPRDQALGPSQQRRASSHVCLNSKHWFTASFFRKVPESDARSVMSAVNAVIYG